MRILVIYSHPVETSFSSALHAAVLEGLQGGGHDVIDVDLYADGFCPVLSRDEFVQYRDTMRNSKSVQVYVNQLLKVDGIAFVYPTWWYGWPAMLKGYFDRVWLPGVAFDIGEDGRIYKHRLAHIRCIVVVCTYGSPWWLNRLYLGDPVRKIFSRGLRHLCAPGCRVRWYALYNMDRVPGRKMKAFIDKVRKAMQSL